MAEVTKIPDSNDTNNIDEQLDDHTTETDKPTVSVIKTGMLEKPHGYVGSWVARYYVLTEDALCRFHRKDDDDFFGKQIAKYMLTDVENIALKQDEKSIIHIDIIKHGKRILRAKSIAEATKWKGAITAAVNRAKMALKTHNPRKHARRRTVTGDFSGLVFGRSATVLPSPFRLTVSMADGQSSKGNSLVPDEELCVGTVEKDHVFVVETEDGGSGRVPAKHFANKEKVEYVMEIAYDDEGNEAEIKTNNDDGTDSFGRLLECKLRFRWKNMTNGVKAGKFQGFVKIIVPSLAIGYCTQILREAGAFQGQVILMAILLVFGFGFIWASGAINDIFRKEEDPIRVCYVALLDDNGEISRRNAQKRKELPPIFDADKILESLHDDREDPENQARISVNIPTPQRWLNCEPGDPRLARVRWKFTSKWREEQCIDRILEIPHTKYERMKPIFQNFYFSVDKSGIHPVYIERPAQLEIGNLKKAGLSIGDFIFHYLWITEYIWEVKFQGDENAKTLQILDLKGLSISLVRGKTFEVIKKMIKLFGMHWPERSFKAFIVNAPFWFNSIWGIIRNFLNKRTVEKFRVFSSSTDSKFHKELLNYVDAENLPERYGGTNPCKLAESPLELEMKAYAHSVVKKNNMAMEEVTWRPSNR